MLQEQFKSKKIILGSGSPRRKQLLSGLDIDFEIIVKEIDEKWPPHLQAGDIPEHIARKKSEAFGELEPGVILITADTTVWINNKAVNKPKDAAEAKKMIQSLSGNTHQVYTGVAIRDSNQCVSFFDGTTVKFRSLTKKEIDFYIDCYQPFDKAGAYGAQDWIGYVGIERLEGCYYNVMGLPTRLVHECLLSFAN